MKNSTIILFILLWARTLSQSEPTQLIIWNVGQGLWATISEPARCIHFDIGGEYMDWPSVVRECRQKLNELFISHSDWDHIGHLKKAKRLLPHLCRQNDLNDYHSPIKKRLVESVPLCAQKLSSVSELTAKLPPTSLSNAQSHVWIYRDQVLLPGDSPVAREKLWAQRISPGNGVHTLILGHHGSQTSTSEILLDRLKELRVAIASSRKKRYGHPHHKVVQRVHAAHVSVIATEEWGHIRIALRPPPIKNN